MKQSSELTYANLLFNIIILCWDYLNVGETHTKIQAHFRSQVRREMVPFLYLYLFATLGGESSPDTNILAQRDLLTV